MTDAWTIPPELPRLGPRPAAAHKGDFGRAVLLGGSRGMSGAIALAGMAALRSGTGLVTLAVPHVCLETVAAFEPSYMTLPLPNDAAGRIAEWDSARSLLAAATSVACGPGLGRSAGLVELVAGLYRELAQPLVVDADGLTALAEAGGRDLPHAGPRILTPHPGEFRRLLGTELRDRAALEAQAIAWASAAGAVLVLKGQHTLVTDGDRHFRNPTGNPGMATGGAGDVLTGVITGLLCQGLESYAAAQLGVFLHGLAGDLAARRLGEVSLIARDLIDELPEAFQILAAATNSDA